VRSVAPVSVVRSIDRLLAHPHLPLFVFFLLHLFRTVADRRSLVAQCYRCGNIASILLFDEHMDRSLKIFREVPESGKANSQKAGVQYFY
jgi:hypothetical protein